MPEAVMSHVIQSSALRADITRHINELRDTMDQVAEGLDGFSESDSGSDESDDENDHVAKPIAVVTEIRRSLCKSGNHLKNGLVVRRNVGNLSRIKSAGMSAANGEKAFPKSPEAKSNKTKEWYNISKTKEHHRTNHKLLNSVSKSVLTKDSESEINKTRENDTVNEKLTNNVTELYDSTAYLPIRAGQDEAEAEVPIMSPLPVEEVSRSRNCSSACSSRYGRPMSLHFLTKGEHIKCEFGTEKFKDVNKTLVNISDKYKASECICASHSSIDSVFGGWEVAPKFVKTKNGKRRRGSKQQFSDVAFDRLTGATNYNKHYTVQFQHYRNPSKYIESYRLMHTVDNAGRHQTTVSPSFVKKPAETDPYYSKMKSTICAMATTCDLYSLLAPAKRDNNSPMSSNDSVNEKTRSDEESYEDGGPEFRPYTVRDRGKILNLAPVRECTVPEMTFKEKQEQFQQNYVALNQYLNLMTPPMPAHGLQFEIDEAKMRRNGFRIVNTGDNNLFPACTPRRGARPLRLGSAEFLKPGSGQNEQKWAMEKRASLSAINNQSTVPGTIIVGSTVPSSAMQSRAKGSGKQSPYVQYQKEHLQPRQGEKPQTPPQHVAGKKFRPCERVSDLTSSARDKGRFLYTHAAPPEKPVVQYRSATMVDWDDRHTRRDKSPMKIDVNHLGIRGHTLKSDESIALYKQRRTATLKSL